MEAHIIDSFLAPILVPSIMGINAYKQTTNNSSSLLYTTVTISTILSAIYGFVNFHINRRVRSRTKLTLLTALQITLATVSAIVSFHFIRLNFESATYELPLAIRGQRISSSSDVFRHHFFADFVPGLIILTQTQLCAMIKHDLLCKAKRAFTFGEASLVSQLVSAAYLAWALTTYSKFSGAGPFQVNLTVDIILSIGFLTFTLAFLPSYLLLTGASTIIRYGLLGLCVAVSYCAARGLIAASSTLDPLTWLVDYIFSTHQRISLFSLWLSTLTACVSFSTSWTRMVGQTNSLVRKIFHLAICVVFISGFNQDIDFTRFAAGGILIVLFILEMIRAWQLPPIGAYLERVCRSLRGKWDNKYLTLSHMYLLVGTFLPFWLLPEGSDKERKLILSSGLISVGVGDTAAAIVGTFLGKTKIKHNSNKTIEGLTANIFAMILFKILWVGFTDFAGEFSFIMAAILTAFIEAATNTCDNLILPLVMTLFLEIF